MPTFKLLDLPYVVIKNILFYLEPVDILDLSLCSKKSSKVFKSQLFNAQYCNLIIRTSFDKKISVEISFSEDKTLSWMFYGEFYKKHVEGLATLAERRFANNVALPRSYKNCKSNSMVTICKPAEFTIKTVVDHLLTLFPCPIKKMEVELDFFKDQQSFLKWTHTHSCKVLVLRATESSKEDVLNVLDTVDVSDSLEIKKYDGEPFEHEKLLATEEVKLKDALCLTEESFRKMNCSRVELGDTLLKPSDLNEAILRWYRGNWEGLETLEVAWENFDNRDMDEMFENIQTHKWNEEKRHRYYRRHNNQIYDCKKGIDIHRPDGKIATFLYANHCLNFFIWHQPFPDFSLPENMYYYKRRNNPQLFVAAYRIS